MGQTYKPAQKQPTAPVIEQLAENGHSSTLEPIVQKEPPDRMGHRRRRMLPLLAALVVLGIGLLIAWREHSVSRAANAKPKTPPATPVVAAQAYQGDIPLYFTGLGAVTPLSTVTIKTRVDGQIMRVSYNEGEAVHKGQPLVEIDPRPYEVQLMQAQGQLARDQATLNNARVDLQRYQTLIAKNAVAQQVYATQKAVVAQNEGNVKTDEGNVASAKLNIAYCHITAPITGRVGLRLVDRGNLVTAAAATPLVVITQTEPISVIFTLPEVQVPAVLKRVRGGQRLKVDALDRDSKGVIAAGTLATLDNQIDQTTGTLRFRATFLNKDESLFPNQFVNARLLVQQKQNVTLVPNAAIQRNGTATFLWVLRPDSTVTLRNVTIGTTSVEASEVISGVTAGEVVVVQGVDKLQEGARVQAQIQQPGQQPAKAPAGATSKGSNAPGRERRSNNSSSAKTGSQRTRSKPPGTLAQR